MCIYSIFTQKAPTRSNGKRQTCFPTANLGESPRRTQGHAVTTNEFDDDRQPEMAIWPPTPEIHLWSYDRNHYHSHFVNHSVNQFMPIGSKRIRGALWLILGPVRAVARIFPWGSDFPLPFPALSLSFHLSFSSLPSLSSVLFPKSSSGTGNDISSPSVVWGRAPAANVFWRICSSQNARRGNTFPNTSGNFNP